eukprot:scaffold90043_cov25-Tisochrysis_lutea.AAC.7
MRTSVASSRAPRSFSPTASSARSPRSNVRHSKTMGGYQSPRSSTTRLSGRWCAQQRARICCAARPVDIARVAWCVVSPLGPLGPSIIDTPRIGTPSALPLVSPPRRRSLPLRPAARWRPRFGRSVALAYSRTASARAALLF